MQKEEMRIGRGNLLRLFWAFLKVGLFTIGGAYAMLPVAEKMLKGLYDSMEIAEAFTVAQTLPGVIAANTSAVLGNQKHGLLGAVFAVLGVITPSVIIISMIAMVFSQIQDIELMNKAFSGIRIGVLALLVKSAYELWKKSIGGLWSFAVFALSLAAVSLRFLSAPYVVLTAAGFGLIYSSVRRGGSAC